MIVLVCYQVVILVIENATFFCAVLLMVVAEMCDEIEKY